MSPLRIFFAAVLLVSVFPSDLVGAPTPWTKLLDEPVNDEWKQIVGDFLSQKEARPAETFAAKIAAIQDLIAKSNPDGQTIPIFLSPKLALRQCEAIPATPREPARTAVTITRVRAIDVFRYLADLSGCEVLYTEEGVLFRPKDQR